MWPRICRRCLEDVNGGTAPTRNKNLLFPFEQLPVMLLKGGTPIVFLNSQTDPGMESG